MSFVGDIVEGVGGSVVDLFEDVGSEFKRFSKTELGRAALAGAAIYFGGGYMGWWDTPFTVGGAAGASGVAAETEAGGGLAQELLAGGASATPATTAATTAPATAATGASSAGTVGTVTPHALGSGLNTAAMTETSAGLGSGITAPAATAPTAPAAGNWFTGLNPLAQFGLIQGGLGAVQGAFTPNAIDVEQERARLRQEEEERRRAVWSANTSVGNVNLGMRPRAVTPRALLAPRMRSA